MRRNLATLGVILRGFLGRELPSLGSGWWDEAVLLKLSYQQRATVDENGWSSLDDLDVAALLRVVDGNWEVFRRRSLVSYEARNWLKEASSVRNRWAHEAPGRQPTPERVYRDLDTLTLLSEALAPGSAEAAELGAARTDALAALAPENTRQSSIDEAPPSSTSKVEIAPGNKG